jgi:hypothetical protein
MKTKVDKQIKRYLKSISDKVLESKIYNSYHYEGNIHIRFSDHISPRDKSDINIIKCSEDTYMVSLKGTQEMLNADKVLEYVKAIILIFPTYQKIVDTYVKPLTKVEQERIKLKNELSVIKQEKQVILLERDRYSSSLRKLTKQLTSISNLLTTIEE